MYSQEFKTKTILQPRNNPSTEKYWGVAIDVGYSAVKVFSPNIVASFPSYAQKVEYGYADRSFGNLEKTFIAYRDENKNEYYVGAHAQNDVKVTDSNNSTAALYVRDRWSSPETKVITRVGLALGMMKNQFNDPSGKILHVQTGLPAEYMSMDMDDIKSIFIGHHEFMIKLGSNNWMPFSFDVLQENFAIINTASEVYEMPKESIYITPDQGLYEILENGLNEQEKKEFKNINQIHDRDTEAKLISKADQTVGRDVIRSSNTETRMHKNIEERETTDTEEITDRSI